MTQYVDRIAHDVTRHPVPQYAPATFLSHTDRRLLAAKSRIANGQSPHFGYVGIKRGIDLLVGSILLLIAALPLLILMIMIRMDSRGPALYRQRRIGQGGREFNCLKLRTMTNDADVSGHRDYLRQLITQGDALVATHLPGRPITRIGRVLRRLSLDELPQLVNVLRGTMSLVGPRPPIPYEVQCYSEWHRRRLAVKPGMSGLWQITGRNAVTFNRMCEIDLEYISRRTILLDLKILAITPLRIGRGAG